MPTDDPLHRLLQSADAAANTPSVAAELPRRVRRRRAAKAARSRRIAGSTIAVGVVLLISVVVRKNPEPTGGSLPPQQVAETKIGTYEVARLLAEANALTADADALQRQVDELRLRESPKSNAARGWVATIGDESAESLTDRAASIKICQGDFYLEVRQSSDSARAAYQSVLDYFPTSSLVSVAREKLSRLSMN